MLYEVITGMNTTLFMDVWQSPLPGNDSPICFVVFPGPCNASSGRMIYVLSSLLFMTPSKSVPAYAVSSDLAAPFLFLFTSLASAVSPGS